MLLIIFVFMNKKIATQLRQFANMLHKVTSPKKIRVSGKEILAVDPEAKDQNDNPIEEGKSYMIEVNAPISHYRALKNAYKKGGESAVKQYAEMMNKYVDGHQDMLIETVGGLAERKNSITAGF